MTADPIRFGVLGTGRITRRLIADLQSLDSVRVTAIASRTADRAIWHADQYGVPTGVTGYQALLQRDDVDAVYIALPPSLHHEWMMAAAAAGKHVLCEKPLAVSGQQAAEMAAACDSAGVAWLDAAAWLHHDRTTAFRRWLDDREDNLDRQRMPESPESAKRWRLGELKHVSAAVSFLNPFQSDDHRLHRSLGGGCLLDLGWYAAGAVRFATERLPAEVHAMSCERGDVPHRVTAMLRYQDDVTATVSCGFDTATRKWFEIAGAEASIVCDDFTRPWADKPARCWVHEASGQVHGESFECHQERQMIQTLVDSIRNDDPARLKPFQTQSLETQLILDAMETSIRQRQSVSLVPPVGAPT
ncbi:MAG: Gfo/Idh/MocA family oxidoreductase [Planctomycetota bacterium]